MTLLPVSRSNQHHMKVAPFLPHPPEEAPPPLPVLHPLLSGPTLMLLLTYSHFCHEAPTGVSAPSPPRSPKEPCQPQRKQHPFPVSLPERLHRAFPSTPGRYARPPHLRSRPRCREHCSEVWGGVGAPRCPRPPTVIILESHGPQVILVHSHLLSSVPVLPRSVGCFHTSVGSALLHICHVPPAAAR